MLKGKTALVTGSTSGIGLGIAKALAAQGANIMLNGFGDVEGPKAEIAALGVQVDYHGADMSKPSEIEDMMKQAAARFGRVDILVNNAGVTKDNLVLRLSDADWDLVLGVNLKGAFNFIKAAARVMLKVRSGRIINIASIVGQQGNAGQANYSASKGGLIALTKTCAREFASRQVLVNAIAPGFIRTRMTDAIPAEAREKLVQSILLKRMGEPEDIARAALFLAGDESSYMTGQVLGVNGGMYM